MKYKGKLMVILLILILLTGCNEVNSLINFSSIQEDTVMPSNNSPLFKGTYKLDKTTSLLDVNDEEIEEYKNDKLYISEEIVSFKDRYSLTPSFKSRLVNFKDYVSFKYKDIKNWPDDLKGQVSLLTVTDGQFFYQDIYKLDDDRLAIILDGMLLEFIKESDSVPSEVIATSKKLENEASKTNLSKDKIAVESDVGVLLGLRSTKIDELSNSYFEYKTIWLRRKNAQPPTITTIKDLFLYRDTGFWYVGTEHILKDDYAYDLLFAYPAASGNRDQSRYMISNKDFTTILYLGKDYISIESRDYSTSDKSYGIYELNNIQNNERLDIVELAGENGRVAFFNAANKVLNDTIENDSQQNDYDQTNVGLKRVNGRWEYRSNITINKNNQVVITDFNIDLVPILNITPKESLSISWEAIKTKVPDAIDAYSSPEGKTLIVQTPYEIQVYDVVNSVIADKALLSINIKENDRIVMANWVSGNETTKWQEQVTGQDNQPISTFIRPY